MANVKTVETKKIMIESEAEIGVYKPTYSRDNEPDILTLRATFDAMNNKLVGKFRFLTTRFGKWFEVSDLNALRVLRDVIDEVIKEIEKLTE